MRNLCTYSGAPVWVPSLCRRELGSIEPHQRGEGLRHPVGDHRHGAEHDANLQQRHRHLCALLGLYSSRLHSTDSGEKQERRDMLPRTACCFTRDSGSAGLFLDIFNRRAGGERVGRERDDQHRRFGTDVKLKRLIQQKRKRGDVQWVAPLPALSRTLLPLRFTATISFTPDGPPPASVRSAIKCH